MEIVKKYGMSLTVIKPYSTIPSDEVKVPQSGEDEPLVPATNDKHVQSLDELFSGHSPAKHTDVSCDSPPETEMTFSRSSSLPSAPKRISTKFNKGDITVPEYRWTKEDGLQPNLPSSATTENFRHLPEVVDWTAEPSPRAVVPPAQWASAPSQSAWTQGPPRSLDPKPNMTNGKIDHNATPTLPITAFSFDTTSVPNTPEAIPTIMNHQLDDPSCGASPAISMGQSSYQQYVADQCDGGSPSPIPEITFSHNQVPQHSHTANFEDTAVAFPWGVAGLDTLWQMGYTLGWNSFAQAQSLQNGSQALIDDLMPAGSQQDMQQDSPSTISAHAKMAASRHGITTRKSAKRAMNYKCRCLVYLRGSGIQELTCTIVARVCEFFLQGNCPHGDKCT